MLNALGYFTAEQRTEQSSKNDVWISYCTVFGVGTLFKRDFECEAHERSTTTNANHANHC